MDNDINTIQATPEHEPFSLEVRLRLPLGEECQRTLESHKPRMFPFRYHISPRDMRVIFEDNQFSGTYTCTTLYDLSKPVEYIYEENSNGMSEITKIQWTKMVNDENLFCTRVELHEITEGIWARLEFENVPDLGVYHFGDLKKIRIFVLDDSTGYHTQYVVSPDAIEEGILTVDVDYPSDFSGSPFMYEIRENYPSLLGESLEYLGTYSQITFFEGENLPILPTEKVSEEITVGLDLSPLNDMFDKVIEHIIEDLQSGDRVREALIRMINGILKNPDIISFGALNLSSISYDQRALLANLLFISVQEGIFMHWLEDVESYKEEVKKINIGNFLRYSKKYPQEAVNLVEKDLHKDITDLIKMSRARNIEYPNNPTYAFNAGILTSIVERFVEFAIDLHNRNRLA